MILPFLQKKLMRGMDTMFNVFNNTEVPHPENLKIVISQFGSLADSIAGVSLRKKY